MRLNFLLPSTIRRDASRKPLMVHNPPHLRLIHHIPLRFISLLLPLTSSSLRCSPFFFFLVPSPHLTPLSFFQELSKSASLEIGSLIIQREVFNFLRHC